MSTLTYPFGIGETKQYPKGKFFKINDSSSIVTCIFYNADGGELGRADFNQGDAINDEQGFAYVEVTSAVAQNVTVHVLPFVMVSDSQIGNVNITNTPEFYRKPRALLGNNYLISSPTHAPLVNTGFWRASIGNPAGSGKYLKIKRVSFGYTGAFTLTTKVVDIAAVTGQDVKAAYDKSINSYGVSGSVATVHEDGSQGPDFTVYESRVISIQVSGHIAGSIESILAAQETFNNLYVNGADVATAEFTENELYLDEGKALLYYGIGPASTNASYACLYEEITK